MKALKAYIPALLTILIALIVFTWARVPLDNWFAGRPVLTGAVSDTVTLDAGPARIGLAVRPDPPWPGKNDLYISVGDALGQLQKDLPLSLQVGDENIPLESNGFGQYRAKVTLPKDAPLHFHLSLAVDGAEHHAHASIQAGVRGIILEGQESGIAFYTCPMHPSVRTPTPGTCPICAMDLIPVTQEEVVSGMVRVDSRRRQLIGVKTATLSPRPLEIITRATGIAAWDETKEVNITARADGWVESLDADYTGKPVKKGDPVVALYVPEIRAAEQELIAAVRGQKNAKGTMLEQSAQELRRATYERVRLLGVSDEELRLVLRTGRPQPALTLYSPVDGVVAEKFVSKGSPVTANQPMLKIASLDPIWVWAHIYEHDASLVFVGQEAKVTFPYLKGKTLQGVVTFIEPALDPTTRTQRVRIDLDNQEQLIRPNMYANVELTNHLQERLMVPHEAVVFAGPRNMVFVDEGAGRMRPVEVSLGIRDDDGWEVLSGLKAGQRVVTSGNFLIGAESRLRASENSW